MKVVSMLARKGGTGKSTISIHMGVLAQADGKRVLFMDLDPQGSLAAWWQTRDADTPSLVQTDARQMPKLLKEAEGSFDLVVVDTPPAVTFDTAAVAKASDLVLIPLRPSILDIYAVTSTAEVVRASKTEALLVLNACQAPRGASGGGSTAEARKALSQLGISICSVAIGQRMDYTRALNGGAAVNEVAPQSKASNEMKRLWRYVERTLEFQ